MNGEGVERATDALLVRGLYPAWLGAGLLDWYWHRQTRIETTAGAPESLMHLIMGFEAGAAFTFALFFDANTFSVGAAFGAALIHELTTIWDVAYTAPRRDIKPREHHTHSFLEVLPFVVAGLIAIRPQKPEPGLRPRTRRLPEPTILALYTGAIIFGLAPHLEELARCARAGQGRSS